MKKLFIASKNKGKISEIKSSLDGMEIELFSILNKPEILGIAETGKTFEENAWIKAKTVHDIVNIPVLADDSGLEVEYLKGAPGVYSSRYAGGNASDDDNCQKLLAELKDVDLSNRKARFRCVIIYYDGASKNIFEGVCKGHIIDRKRGERGFGYDPLFVPDGYSETFGELDDELKNKISHRGKALEKFREYLLKLESSS
ncbi:MAG TPA: XTP/dITP diphosphatase [Ignavibacteria bacterium]